MKKAVWGFMVVAVAVALCSPAAAAILPNNVMANPDLEMEGVPGHAASWFYGGGTTEWSTDYAVSPTHSLLTMGDGVSFAEHRSEGVAIPADVTEVTLQWNMLWENVVLDGDPSEQLGMTLAFFEGIDPSGNTAGAFFGQEVELISSETSNGWVEYTQTYTIPAGAGSFDVRFRAWAVNGAMYSDDISAAFVPEPASLLLLGLGGCVVLRRRG